MSTTIERPNGEYLTYLDDLKESGITNMFGARTYLMEAFDMGKNEAQEVLSYWMKNFGK